MAYKTEDNDCPYCEGRGYLLGGNQPKCYKCEGTGRADHEHSQDKIARLEAQVENLKRLRGGISECLAAMNIMSVHAQTIRIIQSQACADWPRNEESTDRIKANADKAWREFNKAHKAVALKYEDD